ncbi:MAG TPA: hypothetical protein VNZ94_10400 [Xanthobacteraceae bacterium]|nr:hypothetical protein [Xanthobacteraceae bacterium]
MRIVTGLLTAVLLIAGLGVSNAAIRISNDKGGRIGAYLDRFEAIKRSGDTVIIDGLCASACTLVLGTVPQGRICVTPRAKLGFHAAWNPGPNGTPVVNPEATRIMHSMYPAHIRQWIVRNGGLKSRMIFLNGRALSTMYRPCYESAEREQARPVSAR